MRVGMFVHLMVAFTPVAVGATCVSAQPVILADSVAEFSGVQGQANWFYGYVTPNMSSEFIPFPNFGLSSPDVSEFWYIQWDSSGFWTRVAASAAHPNALVSSRLPELQWAVRRWLSEIDGIVRMQGSARKLFDGPADCGDGVVVRIEVDGETKWSRVIEAGDGVGTEFNVLADVVVGSTIDFIVEPQSTTQCDDTVFTATIATLPVCLGDANADGIVDFGDITDVLGNWLAVCP